MDKTVIDAVELNNEVRVNHVLRTLKLNPDKKLNCLGGLSLFEKVLMTPKSVKVIEMCIESG